MQLPSNVRHCSPSTGILLLSTNTYLKLTDNVITTAVLRPATVPVVSSLSLRTTTFEIYPLPSSSLTGYRMTCDVNHRVFSLHKGTAKAYTAKRQRSFGCTSSGGDCQIRHGQLGMYCWPTYQALPGRRKKHVQLKTEVGQEHRNTVTQNEYQESPRCNTVEAKSLKQACMSPAWLDCLLELNPARSDAAHLSWTLTLHILYLSRSWASTKSAGRSRQGNNVADDFAHLLEAFSFRPGHGTPPPDCLCLHKVEGCDH